jgi:hypothetical protein
MLIRIESTRSILAMSWIKTDSFRLFSGKVSALICGNGKEARLIFESRFLCHK